MAHSLWPLFDLRLRTPRLELRLPTDDELIELARLARAGIHDPDVMPFAYPWTDLPSPAFERGFAQYHWRARGDWRPDRWDLELMVEPRADSEGGVAPGLRGPLGMQGLFATDFASLRTVSTGSWLGRAHQGRGIGKEMRAAVLALAFEGLGAEVALSEALVGNDASIGVSRTLYYDDNGVGRLAPRGTAVETRRLRLDRARWEARREAGGVPAVEIEGLEPCLELFGAAPSPTALAV